VEARTCHHVRHQPLRPVWFATDVEGLRGTAAVRRQLVLRPRRIHSRNAKQPAISQRTLRVRRWRYWCSRLEQGGDELASAGRPREL
jgi:hypothetical protein